MAARKPTKPRKRSVPLVTAGELHDTIRELLEASWAAHNAARQVTRGAKDKRTVVRGLDFQKLTEAYALRRQAIAADPEHTDPAWGEEQAKTPTGRDTHAEMMAYYREKLGV